MGEDVFEMSPRIVRGWLANQWNPLSNLRMALIVWLLMSCMATGADLPKTRLKASDPATWKSVPYHAVVPTGGVTLGETGVFKLAMENNIAYLLNSFSIDHMLVPFRERAGRKNPPDDRPQVEPWDKEFRGANAGRFLMGAGNTLRWIEHPELRKRLNQLIDGIEACRTQDGYILAFPPDKLRGEEANYARAWLTHGLIDAAIAGNPKTYGLLRGHADWFNQWDMLPKLINCCGNAHQGHIASTRTYFTPIGKPEDLQVAEKYYVQDWWMDQLAARQPDAIWKYPLPTAHSYLITSFEAYLDHYRATGDKKYLESMLGAWDLIHDQWEHVGGSMAICEGPAGTFPPHSCFIRRSGHTGETCGSVFWIKFNQRLLQLYPDQEKYAAEIEKSIYNVCLANQGGVNGVRYHTALEGAKEGPQSCNTCCEGQATRLYGSLPEYIYSTVDDGVYVNLFESSTIRCQVAGQTVCLAMKSKVPFDPNVAIECAMTQPIAMKLRLRVPSWAANAMSIAVNGQQVAVGKPGSYAVLDRTWTSGDTVSFTLPMDFRLTRYTGSDKITGHDRYALEYGPILMAATGPLDKNDTATIDREAVNVRKWLKPKTGQPLYFTIDGDQAHEYMPYWLISNQTFCVYPVIEPRSAKSSKDVVQ
jgi:uncharacterized protein